MADTICLRYVGGTRYIIGVPTRDIDVPVDEAYDLVASGLYEPDDCDPLCCPPGTCCHDPAPEAADEVDEEG